MNKKFFALTLLLVAVSAQAAHGTKVEEREAVIPGSITTDATQNKVTIRGESHIKEVTVTEGLQLGADHARVEEIPGQNITRTYVQKPDGTKVLVSESVSERPLDVNERKVGSTHATSAVASLTKEQQEAAAVAYNAQKKAATNVANPLNTKEVHTSTDSVKDNVNGVTTGTTTTAKSTEQHKVTPSGNVEDVNKDKQVTEIKNADGTKTKIIDENSQLHSEKTTGGFWNSFKTTSSNVWDVFHPARTEGVTWYQDGAFYKRTLTKAAIVALAVYAVKKFIVDPYSTQVVVEEEYEYDAYGNLVVDQYGNPVIVAVRK